MKQALRIDLHTHSSVSDGTDTPTELVGKAALAGLDVVALTDHDTAAGWPEAAAAATVRGIELVRGIEISTRFAGRGMHLLAYRPDPDHPGLAAALRRIRGGRDERAPAMIARLQDLGIEITADDIRRVSGATEATGRPHIADALVALGVVGDRSEAFERYLNPGRPAYVDRWAVGLIAAVDLVAAAGGVSVIAHPWGRNAGSRSPDESDLAALREAGLSGIEVDHQDHDASEREQLRAIARRLGLVVTGSSDHHGLGKTDHELGCNTTDPAEYERLLGG